MSPKVKQANFRLPLPYMDLIDEVAERESITKAAVITRALDCLKASYDAGNGGMPVSGAGAGAGSAQAESSQELEELRRKLSQAENRARDAESRASQAESRAAQAEAHRQNEQDRQIPFHVGPPII